MLLLLRCCWVLLQILFFLFKIQARTSHHHILTFLPLQDCKDRSSWTVSPFHGNHKKAWRGRSKSKRLAGYAVAFILLQFTMKRIKIERGEKKHRWTAYPGDWKLPRIGPKIIIIQMYYLIIHCHSISKQNLNPLSLHTIKNTSHISEQTFHKRGWLSGVRCGARTCEFGEEGKSKNGKKECRGWGGKTGLHCTLCSRNFSLMQVGGFIRKLLPWVTSLPETARLQNDR